MSPGIVVAHRQEWPCHGYPMTAAPSRYYILNEYLDMEE